MNNHENPARVLVADDDRNIADLVRMYLQKAGYDVTVARDGDETEKLLKEQSFDLAVLDIMMPGPDGLQIVRHLRRRSELPVIFLSARSSDIDKVAGLQYGADDYVTKPFNPAELVARVQSVLRRSRVGRRAAVRRADRRRAVHGRPQPQGAHPRQPTSR